MCHTKEEGGESIHETGYRQRRPQHTTYFSRGVVRKDLNENHQSNMKNVRMNWSGIPQILSSVLSEHMTH